MIPSNKTFIKNIFHKGGSNSLFLKKEDIPSNASLIILDIAAATRGILIQASLIRDMFTNYAKYEIPYPRITNNSTEFSTYSINYTYFEEVPVIKFGGEAINIYFFE